MQQIVISILHYNSVDDTISCLDSLMTSTFDGISVVTHVLDNGSKSELIIDINKYKKISLVLHKSVNNLGFTGGHNYIFEKIKDNPVDYLLLLNNDSLVEKNFLVNLIDQLKDDNVGAAVPKIYFTKGREFHKAKYKGNETGKVIWYAGGTFDWNNVKSIHRGVDEVDKGQYDKISSVEFATGACLILKIELIKKIGLFDDRYFLYYEDADLSMKILKHGFEIIYVPSSILWHNNAGSSGSGSELHDYFLTRNRMLFGMKYAPLRVRIALIRESMRLFIKGRKWQKIAIRDYYLRNFGKGSYFNR